ncbi:MAG: hypothetical protein H0Z19_10325 [Archaeoglobus sp.]|uniref:hypothetical protein n=1 Tax=Archaeoglobus sp. TaxID=1872626 RepID=UPI001DF9088A|nr:hypothetical protein [Archaeoglobus sp.]MBO8180849.1 hypothetical protein [Archaeoglobus sp.]
MNTKQKIITALYLIFAFVVGVIVEAKLIALGLGPVFVGWALGAFVSIVYIEGWPDLEDEWLGLILWSCLPFAWLVAKTISILPERREII